MYEIVSVGAGPESSARAASNSLSSTEGILDGAPGGLLLLRLGNVTWWVSGVCVLSGTWLFPLAFVPVMFVFYTFQAGPALEGHMHRKYGAEWDEYAARVPMLVPFATCGLEKSASLV